MTTPVLDLRVERPVAGGAMLARHDGRVVLVHGAIPGEQVRARVDRERRDVVHATVIDVVEPDPDRRSVEGDPTCGGQVYRHIAYARQRQLKSDVIADALRRIAHVEGVGSIPVAPSPQRGYRMRARLHVGRPGLGFLRAGTHAVCDPAQTGQLLPDTDQIMAQLGRRLVRSNDRSVLYVDLAENIDADQRALLIRLRHHRAPETVAAWTAGCALSGVAYSTRGQSKARVVSGKPTVSDRVAALTCDPGAGEHRLQRHARSFFQGNRYLLPTPVSAVYRRVTVGPVVDLYAGVGLFAVTLKRFSDSPCTAWARRGTSACTNAGGPMQAYSMDLRERALLDSDAGMKAADVAVKYRVSGSWVRLLKQRRRETGEVAPRVQRHGRRRMLEPHLHTLAALIAEQPDRTLAELKDALGTPASLATIWRAVAALDVTVKKNGPALRTRST